MEKANHNKNADVQFLRYAGPSGTVRPFCETHINRVYRMSEVEKMSNYFGQPALIYAGGYNCRHRWVPVEGDGEMESNLFIDSSWKERFENASKNEKEVMLQEKEFALKISQLGYKAELNYGLKDVQNKDTDLVFEGQYAQLKQPKSSRDRAIVSSLTTHQADTIIIELPFNLEQKERSITRIKTFIDVHPDKRVYLYNKKTNHFEEIKND